MVSIIVQRMQPHSPTDIVPKIYGELNPVLLICSTNIHGESFHKLGKVVISSRNVKMHSLNIQR